MTKRAQSSRLAGALLACLLCSIIKLNAATSLEKIIVDPQGVAQPLYSQASIVGTSPPLAIVAGQQGWIPGPNGTIPAFDATLTYPPNVTAQAAQALKNIEDVLANLGTDFNSVFKIVVYMHDINQYFDFAGVYLNYIARFPKVAKAPPPQTALGTGLVFGGINPITNGTGALLEIDVYCVLPKTFEYYEKKGLRTRNWALF